VNGPRAISVVLAATIVVGACATGGTARFAPTDGRLRVVAAENFWGSIAAQLAGDRAEVTSIVANPATDPHDYEATAEDARRVALADYVIVNGIGYDSWAQKLLDADDGGHRSVLDVGKLVGVKVGGNPHQWYSPRAVARFIARVSADLVRLDPEDATYFRQQRDDFETKDLAGYRHLVAQIRARYAGAPIGGSESIVSPLVEALGLTMKTPESFLDAVAEGNEPTAHDTAIVNRQISDRAIKVFMFNRQNATPDVQRLVDAARAHGIPTTTVTETLTPAGATFQGWQSRELRDLLDALEQS
jgi:zinc/manganese transport system substrate-binding protein